MKRPDRLQRFRRTVVKRYRRRPRLAIAMAFLVTAIVIGGASAVLLAPRTPTLAGPTGDQPIAATWTLAELTHHAEAGEVRAVTVPEAGGAGPASLLAELNDGRTVSVALEVDPGSAAAALASMGHGSLLTAEAWTAARAARALDGASADPFRTVLGWVLPLAMIGLVLLLIQRMRARAAGSAAVGFTRILPTDGAMAMAGSGDSYAGMVRLDDVAGCDEAKLELTESIEFLKSPERFSRLGARIPRGILLYGPPGTGKTMLARAVASEAGVPFIAASGAEFIEKYVGVGSRRVRELFSEARGHGRAVVFIDEFDALGKARGGANSHEEREQTLNQLLVELDGFTPSDGVVVIAATNRLDVLDPAVLRPGRFNRKIHVGLPDVAGRREILAVHARGKPIGEDVDLDTVARKTYGFSGAQLADLLNEAAILAARRHSEALGNEDVHGGWLKVAIGTGRRRSMDDRERSIIAAHEVGHAICGRLHGDKRKVEEISLFAHGEALGVTVSSQEDNDLPSESDLRARLVALMGGRAAEELLFQEVTGGAANDFEQANRIARTMVSRWGMGHDPEAAELGSSGRGSLSFLVAPQGGSLPTEVQAAATRAVRAILDQAHAEALRTLVENIDLLRRLASYLVEHERVDGETFDALVDGRVEVPNALHEWRPAASRPRPWSDIEPYHAGRRTPAAQPAPLAAIEPGPEPVLTPAPTQTRGASRTSARARQRAAVPLAGGRQSAGSLLTRRLRRLAVGYLDLARSWIAVREADPPEA